MSYEQNDVTIVHIPRMRVATFHGFGTEPETEALGQLTAWATPKAYVGDNLTRRVFGFNNPDPSPGSPNYGYEYWMELEETEEVEPEVKVVEFAGGAYATARCEVIGDEVEAIPHGWKLLHAQCEKAGLRFGGHQWLEEHITLPQPGKPFTLDLLMPVIV